MIMLVPACVGFAGAQVIEHKLSVSNNFDTIGMSVSLSGDRVLLGAGNNTEGRSAYIFERQSDGTWSEVAKLIPEDGGTLVTSVSLSGDRALVGAYVFERQGDGTWLKVVKLTASDGEAADFFGWSVSLSGDRALVAAREDDDLGTNSGSAYVFERQGDGTWLEVAKLTASDGEALDLFGWSVSLSGDRALVGSPESNGLFHNSGSAYVFERQADGTWPEKAKLTTSDGTSFDRGFGRAVSLDVDRALVGAYLFGSQIGASYVFERQEDNSWVEVAKLTANDNSGLQQFGISVSLLRDRALIGAWHSDRGRGAAYAFERQEDGLWLKVAKLIHSDGADFDNYDNFGASVSLSGDQALVGAPFVFNDQGYRQGAAYVYDLGSFSVDVEDGPDLPTSHLLSEVYPNPFNNQAHFSLAIEQAQLVQIEIFNALGLRVATLYQERLPARTTHRFTFDAGSLPNGVYVLRVRGETFAAIRTMIFLK